MAIGPKTVERGGGKSISAIFTSAHNYPAGQGK